MVDTNPFGISLTKRYVSQGAEKLLYAKEEIGQSGSIELIDYMGGDDTVVRVATSGHGLDIFPEKFSKEAFIRHLATTRQDVPFRNVQLKFRIKGPIEMALAPVYDDGASVNEYSGRYSVMIDTSYLPNIDELVFSSTRVDGYRQAEEILDLLEDRRNISYTAYLRLLDEKTLKEMVDLNPNGPKADRIRNVLQSPTAGLTRELARSVLGIDNDTVFFWKTDLYNLMHFIAKYDANEPFDGVTKDYLRELDHIAKVVSPLSYEALNGIIHDPEGSNRLVLTMPTDAEIVDPDLSPAGWEPKETRRATVDSLEEILFKPTPYLDNGGVQVVDYMGNDSAPAEAARTSYGEGTKKSSGDKRLLRTLVRSLHTSPLEMGVVSFENKALVFVDPRQAKRHRTLKTTGFMGGTPIGTQAYIPPSNELRLQHTNEKQGRGAILDKARQGLAVEILQETYAYQHELIEKLRALGATERDIRAGLGVAHYTKTSRIGDVHNIFHFLGLRLDSHAQKEIQELAQPMADAMERFVPSAYQAFLDYKLNGERMSRMEMDHLGRKLNEVGAFTQPTEQDKTILENVYAALRSAKGGDVLAEAFEGVLERNRFGGSIDPEDLLTYKGSRLLVRNSETKEREHGRESRDFARKLHRLKKSK